MLTDHKRRATYEVVRVEPGKSMIWIKDLNGFLSVTNDAERVCEELDQAYPGYRIIYQDSDQNWDELVHYHGTFSGYATARELAP